ncbi:MAG: OmpA family protein [Bacteroidota bacterium]
MIRTILFLLLLVFSTNVSAQKNYTTDKTAKKKLLDIFRKGQRLSFNGQSEAALKELDRALKMDPTFIDAQIEWANVKNQQGKYAAAERGYEKALAIDPLYMPGVLYSLGIVEFDQEKFSEASAHFEQYLGSGKASPKRKAKAETFMKNASFAAEALSSPVPFEPVNLGPSINTADHEYLPTLTADGQKLIYTAIRGRQEDFYISQKKEGVWQAGQPITAVNSQYNEGAQSISADGKFLVFTICNRPRGMGRCDLYYTEYKNNQWTPVQNMGSPINSKAYESLPSISADGKLLYFTCDKSGGIGGLDLWVSRRLPDGAWGQPENLGAPINTALDEQAPFIHPDGQTLYFMSKGHPGMGEYDLYVSRKQEDGTWGEPENLGYPINTKGNEGAFTVSHDGATAYYASDMAGGLGKTDIYSFELHEAVRPQPVTYVRAIVSDAISREKLMASVEFIDLASGQPFISAITDADGEFLITLPAGKDYALNVSKEKYLFYSENFALKNKGSIEQPFELKIELNPIPENTGIETADISKPIILKNVFFETASAELKNESIAELNRLKKLLDENPTINIQINGHTDNVGGDEDNLILSENRAKAVYDYLIENNISAARLKYKGFGENMPIATNNTEEGRMENRRTEFVLF